MPQLLRYAFRPVENCDFCQNVVLVERVSQISPQVFAEKYAYSAKPVIVEDATQNWTALEVSNWQLFS